MKYLPKNTLAYYNSAPQCHRYDLSQVPTSVLAQATVEYRKTCGETSPNHDALTFYGLNHCVAVIRKSFTQNEALPAWANQVLYAYIAVLTSQSKRMLHYILSICTREMRHLKPVTPAFWAKVQAESGGSEEMVQFIQSICNLSESDAVKKYMNSPPSNVSLGGYVRALSYAFHKGKWSSGYGGKAWGNVTDAAVETIHGRTSMEMLVDTGYTLAHNGGPIFNKGMMYTHWDASLITVLDVQASGQVPELVLDPEGHGVTKLEALTTLVKLVAANKPNEFRGWVDWFSVKSKDGNESKYATLKAKQKLKHPDTPVQQPKHLQKILHGKKIKVTGTWTVYPGQHVETFERVAS